MLATLATIAFFVFAGFLVVGIFLTGSLVRTTQTLNVDVATRTRMNSLFNFLTMFSLFIGVVVVLWAISNGWGTTMQMRRLLAFLLLIFGLGFTGPFLIQIGLWARCKATARVPAALRAVK